MTGMHRDLTVRLDADLRAYLDALAHEYNFVNDDGSVRDAELVRVLLASVFLSEDAKGARERAAAGLYVNGVLSAFGEAARMIASLRAPLAELAAIVVDSGEQAAVRPPKPRRRGSGEVDRKRVHFSVERWLRDRLDVIVASIGENLPERGREAKVVRTVLRFAQKDEMTPEVLRLYRDGMDHMSAAISRGVDRARAEVMAALREG